MNRFYLLVFVLCMLFISCDVKSKVEKRTYEDETYELEEENVIEEEVEKPLDFATIDCDSLYKEFIIFETDNSYYREEAYELLINYYKCKNFLEKGKFEKQLEILSQYEFIIDEDGVLVGKLKEYGDDEKEFHLLDYDFNILKQFDRITIFRNGLAFAQINEREENEFYDSYFKKNEYINLISFHHYRLINKKGEFLNDERYHDITFLYNGYIEVKKTLYYGLLDSTGKKTVPIKYYEIGHFDGDFIPVRIKSKWGIINKENKKIEAFKFSEEEIEYKLKNHENGYYDN